MHGIKTARTVAVQLTAGRTLALAGHAIGLDPEVLFHEGGYQSHSRGLAFTFSVGGYPGAAGLSASGMALSPAEAAKQGVAPYPQMIRWPRE